LPYKSRNKNKNNQDKIENINTKDISKSEKKLSKRAEIKLNYELNPSLEHAAASGEDSQLEAFSSYCERYSSPEPKILLELREETITVFSHAARMISGQLQGRFLKILTTISKAKNVLELGTFTGYSALCFAEGLPKNGKVYTCEIDPCAYKIANKYFDLSPNKNKIDSRLVRANELLDIVRNKNVLLDMVFIDADKKYYIEYLKNLLGDEYINKGGELILSNKCLLNSNSLIIVDNTLWKGLVLDEVEDLKQYAPEAKLFGRPDRMKVLANTMHSFNEFVRSHQYLEPVLLPLRDGLTAIRYTGDDDI
jgi:caffeoyl-CoA O-methyltransferase